MSTTTKTLTFAAVLSLLLILATLRGQESTTPQPQANRYQIAQGEYVVDVSGGVPEKGVFKIDTATGTTWKYATGMRDGKSYEFWGQVP